MNRLSRVLPRALLCLLLAVIIEDSRLCAKPVRLRNASIDSAAPAFRASDRSNNDESPASGLFLVQLRAAPRAEWRDALRNAGAVVVRFVPDDTYIAEFRNVAPGQIRRLPFVQWVGRYQPEYKVYSALERAATRATGPLNISVVVSPQASAADESAARGLIDNPGPGSRLRSGTVIRGSVPPGRLRALAESPAVLWIEPAPAMKLFDELSSQIVAGDDGPNVLYTESLGYDGSGVTVAVADSGLDTGQAASMHPDLYGRTPAILHYGSLPDGSDGHSHGTHVAGIIAGNAAAGTTDLEGALYGLGVAPGASIISQRIFDDIGAFVSPPTFEHMTRDARRAGAEIGSNSWGDDTQGRYDVSAMEFDELVRDADFLASGDQPYILEFSAGNAGPGEQTIGSPAVAKNVIASGASQNNRQDLFIYDEGQEVMADFSSRGPCEDGRIKPDVVAPGTWIASLKSAFAPDFNSWLPIDSLYLFMGGTSQSGPHVSGAAAVFVQYYREVVTNRTPSPAMVKAALIDCAVDLDDSFGTQPVPNMDEGWGRIDLTGIIGSSRRLNLVDQTQLLSTGDTFERRVTVASGDESLKITLAYTDVPGFPGAIPALVNDLDLEVIAPDGRVYRGNRFVNGESAADAMTADRINNVECVHLFEPLAGEYIVRIHAFNVPDDARIETGPVDQDFALVISGDLALPGQGVVGMDRRAYTAPGIVKLQLVDSDRVGAANVSVNLRSGTEPVGENYVLFPNGSSGVFTGAVSTVTGPAASDGKLQIAHGDLITARYFDASSMIFRTTTAEADLLAPALTDVAVTNAFGQAFISWNSDEPATSIVRFGTNPPPGTYGAAVTNTTLTTSHQIALGGLVPGQTYYFHVASVDEAGNAGTNDNGGALFVFSAAANAPVLVVDQYVDPFFGVPPLSGYTAALDQLGVGYEVWDTSPSPPLSTLQLYQAVIWRVPELTGVWSTAERSAISNYLHGGGGLFVASMELFSRLEASGGAGFIQSVLKVQSYLTDETGSTLAPRAVGVPNEPLGSGLDIITDYTTYEVLWGGFIGPDISDTMTPAPSASVVFQNDVGDVIGIRWPGIGQQASGRLVLLSFPLDAVPMEGGVNDRVELLQRVLAFLAPGASASGTVALDSQAYVLPAVAAVEVGDSDVAGQSSVTVTVRSTTQSNPITVVLHQTLSPGVFSGSFEIISATNPPSPGAVLAQNGDLITVEYVDLSTGGTNVATATIDTEGPVITDVDDEADYETAIVFWETTEPTDALVQFGESALLGRTAYNATLSTSHAVELTGLVPDRTYFYRVVSRDAAGNTATDDNGGTLHTFTTLMPVTPPWSDDMNSGPGAWVVFNAEETQSEWTLGVPNNGHETSAYSPPDAWGSNLNGLAIDYAQSFLISPAISLVGGNKATLRFRHSYDFTETSEFDILEFGQVLLLVNNGTTAVTLGQYGGLSSGWEDEEIDLTPYVGKLIYLVWDYELLSFETRLRPGWLVDDVSVTVTNVIPGAVEISKNLWQPTYVLTGGVNRRGRELQVLITNAPPGDYVIQFGDVPFYTTPPPLTNVLDSSELVSFQGLYTFADVNNNGMSDAWEQFYFNEVSQARTALTDSDNDGKTDAEEFVSGTDPTQASSRFRIESVTRLGTGSYRVRWQSSPGRAYRIYSSTDMATWTPLSGWQQARIGHMNFTVLSPASGGREFFRIEVRP